MALSDFMTYPLNLANNPKKFLFFNETRTSAQASKAIASF
jgi:hypothetical protein